MSVLSSVNSQLYGAITVFLLLLLKLHFKYTDSIKINTIWSGSNINQGVKH